MEANQVDVQVDIEPETINAPEPESRPAWNSQHQSPLLRLPLELRLTIYQLLLCPPQLADIRRVSARGYCSDYVLPPLSLTPALLATCRQINHEATPVLYACNKFGAHPNLLTDLPHLITSSRPITHGRGKAMIRKWYVNVRLDTDPRYNHEKVRRAFEDAEELEIDVFQAMFGSSDFRVLRLYEGIRGLEKCKIHGSVGDGRYARWLQDLMCQPVGSEPKKYIDDEKRDGDAADAHMFATAPTTLQLRLASDFWTGTR